MDYISTKSTTAQIVIQQPARQSKWILPPVKSRVIQIKIMKEYVMMVSNALDKMYSKGIIKYRTLIDFHKIIGRKPIDMDIMVGIVCDMNGIEYRTTNSDIISQKDYKTQQ